MSAQDDDPGKRWVRNLELDVEGGVGPGDVCVVVDHGRLVPLEQGVNPVLDMNLADLVTFTGEKTQSSIAEGCYLLSNSECT